MMLARRKNLSKTKQTSAQEDRARSKTLAKVVQLGRSLCKPLPQSDARLGELVALSVGIGAIMRQLSPPGTVPSFDPYSNKYLRVPDAETLATFLKQARQVYRKAHDNTSRRGRPSDEENAFMSLLQLEREQGCVPSQGEIIRTLMELKLSGNTAYKYAKLYRLSLRWTRDQTQLTETEQKWFARNNGIDSCWRLYWMRLYLHHKCKLEEMGGSELF